MEKFSVGDRNKSAVYILPLLGNKDIEFFSTHSLPQCQFRNCFIGDKTTNIENKILILYKFSADNLYLEFENLLEQHSLFEKRYEVDKSHTMFVFNIPNEFIEDYNKLIKGEYSKVSGIYKKHILAFHGLNTESFTAGVLYKKEANRKLLEERINQGLPTQHWTKIPVDVELDEPFNDKIEYYREQFKVKSPVQPNIEFKL